MAWISVIDEREANDELKRIYNLLAKKRGKISNILKVHSLHPDALQTHMDLYLSIMFNRSNLTRADKELIAVIVSSENQCEYCINHHAEALRYYWKADDRINDVISKKDTSEFLNEHQKAIVRFALKLTTSPSENTCEDIKILKKAGFKDKEILEIVLIIGYFNFVNRIALGLGVEFNEDEIKGYQY